MSNPYLKQATTTAAKEEKKKDEVEEQPVMHDDDDEEEEEEPVVENEGDDETAGYDDDEFENEGDAAEEEQEEAAPEIVDNEEEAEPEEQEEEVQEEEQEEEAEEEQPAPAEDASAAPAAEAPEEKKPTPSANPYAAAPKANPYAAASTDAKTKQDSTPKPSANPYAAAPKENPYAAAASKKSDSDSAASSNPYAKQASKKPPASSNPYAAASSSPSSPAKPSTTTTTSASEAPSSSKKKKKKKQVKTSSASGSAGSSDFEKRQEKARKAQELHKAMVAKGLADKEKGNLFEKKFAKKLEAKKAKSEKRNQLTPAQLALKEKKAKIKEQEEQKKAALRASAKITGGSINSLYNARGELISANATEKKLKEAWIKKHPTISNRKTRAELVKEREEAALNEKKAQNTKDRESGWGRGGGSVKTMYDARGNLMTPEQIKARKENKTPRNMGAHIGSPRKAKTRTSIKEAWTKSRTKTVPLQGKKDGEAIRDPAIRKAHSESKAALVDVAKRLADIKKNLVTPSEADNILERETQARQARDRVYQFRVLLAKLQEYNELQAEEIADERARLREQEMHFEREMERRDLEKRADMERTAKQEIMEDRLREKKRYETLKDTLRRTEEQLVQREVELDRRERDLRFRESTDEAKKWRDEMEIQRREFEMERDHFERSKRDLKKTEHAMQMKIAELQDKLSRAHASVDRQTWEHEQKMRERERVERVTLRALEDKLIERELAVERKEARLSLRDTEAYTELQQDYEAEKARVDAVRHERDELADELSILNDKNAAIVETLESKIAALTTRLETEDHAETHPAKDLTKLREENEMLKLKLAEQAFALRLAKEKQDRTATRLGDYKAQHKLAQQGHEDIAKKYAEYKRWAPDQPTASDGLPEHLLAADVSAAATASAETAAKPSFSGWGSGPIAKHKLGARARGASSSSSSLSDTPVHCYSCGSAYTLRRLPEHLKFCPEQRAEALKKQMGDAFTPMPQPTVALPDYTRNPSQHDIRVYDNEALRIYEASISSDPLAFYA